MKNQNPREHVYEEKDGDSTKHTKSDDVGNMPKEVLCLKIVAQHTKEITRDKLK